MPIKDPAKRRERHRVYMRDVYLRDPVNGDKHRKRVRNRKIRYAREVRALLAEFKSSGCVLCGESHACCLSAHHVNSTQKRFQLSNALEKGFAINAIKAEMRKCICLCENCHRKIHAGVLVLPDHLRSGFDLSEPEESLGGLFARLPNGGGM